MLLGEQVQALVQATSCASLSLCAFRWKHSSAEIIKLEEDYQKHLGAEGCD